MTGIGNHTTGVQHLRRYIDTAERKVLDPVGLTVSQFETIDTLSRYPGVSAADLGDLLHVSRQATTIMVANLVDRALIERGATGAGRAMPLVLSRASRTALKTGRAAASRVDAVFTAAYDPTQLAELQRLLAVGVAAFQDLPVGTVRTGA
jgi:DNA-binding MarR family transcriptional regulator